MSQALSFWILVGPLIKFWSTFCGLIGSFEYSNQFFAFPWNDVMKIVRVLLSASAICAFVLTTFGASSLSADEMKLKSAGPIAFGPNGLLLVSDPMEAKIYAIETGDTEGSTDGVTIEIDDLRSKIASMMGAKPEQIRINDLAVNPINGRPYLSVTRGSGADEVSVILSVDPKSKEMSVFDMASKKSTHTLLPNPVASKQSRRGNQRLQAITDMAFIDNQIYVAGLSNEEFASNLRAINYPFKDTNDGASIEIYHGAHGKFETRAPIRTFAAMEIEDEVNLLAAYTCTPLVRIPLGQLKPKSKVKGTTIAELGNWNRPLDMVVYKKDDKNYALMANSHRGVMKIDLSKAGSQAAITEPVKKGGIEGVKYETVKDLKNVVQLDGLSKTHGVVLIRSEDGKESLKTIALP